MITNMNIHNDTIQTIYGNNPKNLKHRTYRYAVNHRMAPLL